METLIRIAVDHPVAFIFIGVGIISVMVGLVVAVFMGATSEIGRLTEDVNYQKAREALAK